VSAKLASACFSKEKLQNISRNLLEYIKESNTELETNQRVYVDREFKIVKNGTGGRYVGFMVFMDPSP
jgi:hypothetical protein